MCHINVYCVAVIAIPPLLIYTDAYIHLYAVTGFMFVLPGLTLKIVPLTNFLCYCRIALLFFCFACCCRYYYWRFCFSVCFALVVLPPVAEAAILAMLLAKHTHTLSRRHENITHIHAHTNWYMSCCCFDACFCNCSLREA